MGAKKKGKKSKKGKRSSSKKSGIEKKEVRVDAVAPESLIPPVPPRQKLVDILTEYVVNEKEVYNIKVSTRVLEDLAPHEIKDLHFVFDALDSNKDGLMNTTEVHRALIALGFKVTKGEVRKMMAEVDLSSTGGECNLNTFLEFVIERQGDDRDDVEELHKSFKLFDLERNGRITVETLTALCKEHGVRLRDVDIQEMFYAADAKGDNYIDREEFVEMMLKTNLFA